MSGPTDTANRAADGGQRCEANDGRDDPRRTSTRHGGDDEELVMFLERDQLAADRSRPLPRASLSRRAQIGLWALRVFGLVVGALVIYTFAASLGH